MKHDLVSLIKRARSQLGAGTYLWTTAIVVVAGMVVSFLSAASQNQRFKVESVDFLNRQSMRVEEIISQRMNSYEQILDASRALFNISGHVSRDEWHNFIQDLSIGERFPGTLGIGYGESVPANKLDDFIAQIRQEGFSNFTVNPPGARNQYVPVTYIEPFSEQNSIAFGYDMFSEPTRRAAIEYARDSGDVSVSGVIRLLQDGDVTNAQPGVIIYMPHYANSLKLSNTTQRRSQITGYSYAVLRMGDLFAPLLHNFADDGRYAIEIIDSPGESSGVLYQSSNYDQVANKAENEQKISHSISIINRTWGVNLILDDDTFRGGSLTPANIFIIGSGISVLIGALIFVLMLNRLGRIAIQHEIELQEAKDELLALASHQLRTPASGVKQYIGMLLQGYSGQVSREQRQMLKRAYESNERQLEIINQLLYVAKADAGQLRLEKEHHNFSALVNDVVSDFSDMARDFKVDIKINRSKPVELKADKRYVRMIVENLLSNAIKYSFENSEVELKIDTKGRQLIFTVKDHGVGIEEHDFTKLFQKFTRIGNPLSGRTGGSGIGLYLSQRLAEAHGGRIVAKSNSPRKGVIFTLCTPGVKVAARRKRRKQ